MKDRDRQKKKLKLLKLTGTKKSRTHPLKPKALVAVLKEAKRRRRIRRRAKREVNNRKMKKVKENRPQKIWNEKINLTIIYLIC